MENQTARRNPNSSFDNDDSDARRGNERSEPFDALFLNGHDAMMSDDMFGRDPF